MRLDIRSLVSLAGIAATPLILAGMGVTHPHELTPQTAGYWHLLHYLLLPIFPLLGVNLWWLLRGVTGPLAWIARGLAFIYMTFYGALDVLAGIGTGLVMMKATATDQPALTGVNHWLFAQGNELAEIGVWAFGLACILVSVLLIRRVGRMAIPGSILLLGAAISFLSSHIYYPIGVVTMLVMAFGFGWLEWARLRGESLAAAKPTLQEV